MKPPPEKPLWTRRELLRSSLACSLLPLLGGRAFAQGSKAPTTPKGGARPRYFLILLLEGGIDAVFTTNPKRRSEVDSWVDVPYGAQDILEAGNLQLGPHLAPIRKWAGQLAILNGVQVKTANHQTGQRQFIRLKTQVNDTMPSLPDILGEHREGQPLGSVSLGTLYPFVYSPRRWFGAGSFPGSEGKKTLFEQIDEIPPDELGVLADVLKKQARQTGSSGGLAHTVTGENLQQCAALFERLRTVPRFKVETWSEDEGAQSIAGILQRVLWLFEHDLTRAIYCHIDAGASWDTHYSNDKQQAYCSQQFFPMFERLLASLASRRNGHGELLGQTLTVMGSELGRHPQLNDHGGKDHFPETPFMFWGAGINTGGHGAAYGKTGRQMQAVPISLRTGRDVSTGGSSVSLDDIGATVLHLAGHDPRLFGYDGQILDFLVGA